MGKVIDTDALECYTEELKAILDERYGTTGGGATHIVDGTGEGAVRSTISAPEEDDYEMPNGAFAVGYNSKASANNAHAEGNTAVASNYAAHAEGNWTTASGYNSHAEGNNTKATANAAHAEGYNTEAKEESAHAEGSDTRATNYRSHAEGYGTYAEGANSHAEGYGSHAEGANSHAEGHNTEVTATDAHAEGDNTKAIGNAAHAEGYGTEAGVYSHAEGNYTKASGNSSHAEGNYTKATGEYSHAEGNYTEANSSCSHASGSHTKASSDFQFVMGKYNVEDTENKYALIVGNGEYNWSTQTEPTYSNAFAVKWDGTFVFANGTEITPAQFASLVGGITIELTVDSDGVATINKTYNELKTLLGSTAPNSIPCYIKNGTSLYRGALMLWSSEGMPTDVVIEYSSISPQGMTTLVLEYRMIAVTSDNAVIPMMSVEKTIS